MDTAPALPRIHNAYRKYNLSDSFTERIQANAVLISVSVQPLTSFRY